MNPMLPGLFLALSLFILPFMSHASGSDAGAKKDNHSVPRSYLDSVKRLESVQHELKELSKSYRLYQFHEPLKLYDAILGQLHEKADHDIFDRIRKEVRAAKDDISHIAKELDTLANSGDSAKFNHKLSNLRHVIKRLDKYSSRSNEVRVSGDHNVPPTYRKLLNRMRGIAHALHELSEKGYLHKAHSDLEYLESATNSLEKHFEANVIAAMKHDFDENLSILKKFSHKMHEAGDNEDKDAAISAFTKKVSSALHKIEEMGESGHSVQSKLEKADHLFKKRKLTKPAGGNAYELYRSVLDADPSNKRAKEGIHKIVEWYLHHIDEYAEKGDWNKVGSYSKSVLAIDPHNTKAREYRRKAKANHHH